jgi:hypothetical protein
MGIVLEDGMARVKGAHWPTGGVLQFFAGLNKSQYAEKSVLRT